LPQTAEERLLIAPPEKNMDTTTWRDQPEPGQETTQTAEAPLVPTEEPISTGDSELEAFRRRLEGLL
jgi:hypothetical protein